MTDVFPFDVATASEGDLRALHRVAVELEREERPDDPPEPYEEFVALLRTPPRYRREWYYAARLDGEVAGYAHLYLDDVGDNEHLAYLDGGVAPAARRQGVAARLLAPVLERARDHDRRLLTSDAPDGHEASEMFFLGLGGERRYVERRSRLLVDDVDHVAMKGWIEQASERAGDYEMFGWDGSCPDDLIESYTRLLHVMNTAPMEDLDFEDEVFTPDRLRAEEACMAARGWEWSTVVVRHVPTGELAGLTELQFPRGREWLAYQGNTGVDPLHRNKGIGRWLKAVMIENTAAQRPDVRCVDTWNANSNDAMLNINVAMGFAPVVYMGCWQTPVDAAASALEARQ